jgi:FkbM family methyltransferase
LDRFTVAEVFSERAYSFDGMLRKPALLECLRQQAADGFPIIVDGGANIGASSVLLAALYPAARIIAVEPEPRNVELHTRNCAGIQAISLVPAAIGPADGEAMLSAGDNPRGHHLSVEGNVKVRVVSIESLLAPIHRGIPFMLKLDIEGAEELLFADEAPWIDRFPVIVIEPHDRKYPKSSKIRAFLRHLGARDRDFLIEGENIVSISNALVG